MHYLHSLKHLGLVVLLLAGCASHLAVNPGTPSQQDTQTASPVAAPAPSMQPPAPTTAATISPAAAPQQAMLQRPIDSNTPIGVIQRYESEIRRIITKYDGKKSAKQVAERDKLLGEQVRKFFDFEELAHLTLANHWKSLSQADRQHFTNTFIQLIERTYLNKTREMIAEYQVLYDDESIKNGRARVNSRIKKADVDVQVVYELKTKGNNQWQIYNVIFDNLDLLSNYKSQFNRIIVQKSFAELMRVMENRLKNPADAVKL